MCVVNFRQTRNLSQRHLALFRHLVVSCKLFGRGSRSMADKPCREKSVSKDKAEGGACKSLSLQSCPPGAFTTQRCISCLACLNKRSAWTPTLRMRTCNYPCFWAMRGGSTVIQWPWHLPAENKMSALRTSECRVILFQHLKLWRATMSTLLKLLYSDSANKRVLNYKGPSHLWVTRKCFSMLLQFIRK